MTGAETEKCMVGQHPFNLFGVMPFLAYCSPTDCSQGPAVRPSPGGFREGITGTIIFFLPWGHLDFFHLFIFYYYVFFRRTVFERLFVCWLPKSNKGSPHSQRVGWHHRIDGHECEQTLGVGDGQGGLACCSPWGLKELD